MQLEIQRRLGPEGRLELALEMSDFARKLAEAGLRRQCPELSPQEVHRELILRLYGPAALG